MQFILPESLDDETSPIVTVTSITIKLVTGGRKMSFMLYYYDPKKMGFLLF